MKVLLTGSSGFMGSHLSKRLRSLGHTVWGMDKKIGSSTSNFALTVETIKEFNPDIIVHLGANCSSQISLREPMTDFIDNTVGTFNVLEANRIHRNVPVIFNSTMKVYPGTDGIIPPYGISKLTGEQYIQLYHDVYGLDYVINRPSSVYGPMQDGSDDGGWLTWFCKAKVQNKQINLYGDGSQSRDVLYIDDCIDILLLQIQEFNNWKNDSYDFGGGMENELSLNELLDYIDYHNTVIKPKLQGDVGRFVCNNSKVNQKGWKPQISWKEGVRRTIQWLESEL